MEFKTYTIKKGNHRSGIFPNFHFNLTETKYSVIFKNNCLYHFGDMDDFAINKLFGISRGFHHDNSVRFGWNTDGEQIAIYAYYYKLGKTYFNKIVSILVDEIYHFEISVHDAYYEMRVLSETGNLLGWSNIAKPQTVNWGYRLYPYFGGKKVAPHTMKIQMKKIW